MLEKSEIRNYWVTLVFSSYPTPVHRSPGYLEKPVIIRALRQNTGKPEGGETPEPSERGLSRRHGDQGGVCSGEARDSGCVSDSYWSTTSDRWLLSTKPRM